VRSTQAERESAWAYLEWADLEKPEPPEPDPIGELLRQRFARGRRSASEVLAEPHGAEPTVPRVGAEVSFSDLGVLVERPCVAAGRAIYSSSRAHASSTWY
jgi:hypothetical protein